MARAVEGLAPHADFCLVDGLPVKGLPVPHRAIVKGDGRSLSIAAASVLAKVTRDRMMTEADASYPQYGFAKHKGYGTKAHMEALRRHGPVRFIAARLRRFHKWNCPFLNRKERDTAWLGMYGELAAASFLRGEGFSVFKEELASRQGRGTGPRVPGRELPGFCGSENPYGETVTGEPAAPWTPAKGR